MSAPRLLLLSASREGSTEYLEHAEGMLDEFLGKEVKRVTFIPYASVQDSYDDYAARTATVFSRLGYALESIHRSANPVATIRDTEALVVGGGNSFHLLNQLYANDLMAVIRERVAAGMPYLGWSAGSIVAGKSIGTTNDMPIVYPPSFNALQLLPLQINPHFIAGKLPGHHSESREERLQGFLALNPGAKVVALAEGSALRREGSRLTLLGTKTALLFSAQKPVQNIQPAARLDHWLTA